MLTVDPFYDIRALTANARLLFGKVLANDMRKRLLLDRVTLILKLEKAYRERRSKRKLVSLSSRSRLALPAVYRCARLRDLPTDGCHFGLESTLSLECVKLAGFIHDDMVYKCDSDNVTR